MQCPFINIVNLSILLLIQDLLLKDLLKLYSAHQKSGDRVT